MSETVITRLKNITAKKLLLEATGRLRLRQNAPNRINSMGRVARAKSQL